jgi:hypothetical protein
LHKKISLPFSLLLLAFCRAVTLVWRARKRAKNFQTARPDLTLSQNFNLALLLFENLFPMQTHVNFLVINSPYFAA